MKIKENNKCDYCDNVDFVEHSLVCCDRLHSYWQNVIEWIKKEIGINIPSDLLVFKLFGILKGDVSRGNKKRIEKVFHDVL